MNEEQQAQEQDDMVTAIQRGFTAAGKEIAGGPLYPNIVYPGKPADIPYDVTLYDHLQAAEAEIPAFPNQLQLEIAASESLPFVGPLLGRLRQGLHKIALFYTNRAVKHQLQINRHLAQSLGRLMAVTQEQQRQIQVMNRRLAELERSAGVGR